MTEMDGRSDLAYRLIRRAIAEGDFEPGSRLVEQRIGEMFDLSRTPVREALRALAADGLVVIERNRGAVVATMSEADIRDQYELRARLESLAAERAATRMGAEGIAALDVAIADFDAGVELVSGGSLEAGLRRITAANNAFHQRIVEGSAHRRLSMLLVHAVDIPLVYQVFRHQTRAESERSNLFHRMVRDAIAASEPERAGALMAEHIMQGRDCVLAVRSQTRPEPQIHAS
ncbi:GntR family transcriptional regulator [Mycobacterium sp. Aquia_213]|uniref:GntR family transcriptional regulator n=1 Tax=Mycobacterium sp. Aquia_213 TaxID=2991728 RepID=UPI00226EBC1B|nr:GntR family transcriptional regulator [Mycobacterium sp. Aquia_213]WAC93890.1 GntR family transcriptional regulator [Mycobacterium sp. Aquia_213]